MANQNVIGKTATSVFTENGITKVIYHSTCVISWDEDTITLDSGGWLTATTKTRINQAANQFGLGLTLRQKAGEWIVSYNGSDIPFNDGMSLKRI